MADKQSFQAGVRQLIAAPRTLVVGVSWAACASACGETPAPRPNHVLSVAVTPDTTTVRVGSAVSILAQLAGSSDSAPPRPDVTWTSSASTVATIDAMGTVTGVTPGHATIVATTDDGVRGSASVTVIGASPSTTITVNAARQFQTMTGWEVLPGTGYGECDRDAYNVYMPELLDRTVNELHINRVRLPLRAAFEHPNDAFKDFNAGKITFDGWKAVMFRPQNDNADPFVIEPNGFNWSFLDFSIEQIVLPMRQRLRAIGDDLWFSFGYTGANSGLLHRDNPEEYAELVLAAFQHLRDKYGLVPNSWDVVNEPNLGAWSPAQVAANLLAARRRLNAAGFFPQFVGPTTSWALGTVQYFDEMTKLPEVRQTLSEISYHRYGPITLRGHLQAIARRGNEYRMRTAMTEHIGSGYLDLHDDLTIANVSAWQQFGLAFCLDGEGGGGGLYFMLHGAKRGQKSPRVVIAKSSKHLRQYFRYVRLGAVRVGATTVSAAFSPVAFRNPDGRFTVVVKAGSGGTFTVGGLPAGSYGIEYTTDSQYARSQPDVTVNAGQPATATIPEAGAITIYAK